MQLFLEVYAGSARLSAAMKRRGIDTSPPWDIDFGRKYDLCIAKNARRLYNVITSGHIIGVWWGTPCSSFTSARRWDGGPPPLRTRDNPEDPGPWLSDHDKSKVAIGYLHALITIRGIKLAHSMGAWVAVESPIRSMLWQLPSMINILNDINADSATIEFCAYGLPWQKQTLLRGTLPRLKSLTTGCTRWPLCKFTQKPHQSLRGYTHGGISPLVAQDYPEGLCAAVADLAFAQLHGSVGEASSSGMGPGSA